MTLKQNWTEVKKQLKYCSERDLLGLVQDLYRLNRDNKEYLHLKFLAGNSPEQKEKLLSDSVNTIRTKWGKAYHDPYGYGGDTVRVKITPMKEPVITYKKAIGIDQGYVTVLAEYIISGYQFLKTNCAEPADAAINSINSIAKELFDIIATEPTHIRALSRTRIKKIQAFIDDYEAGDEAILSYEKVQEHFTKQAEEISQ